MNATVLICTRNRADSLARCLDAIAADSSRIDREVLVVDNGSSDHTRDVVSCRGVRLISEPVAGSSVGRNTGIRHAEGDVVLFTDDDVFVRDGWADALCGPFADPSVAAAGGRVLPVFATPPPAWLQRPYLDQFALTDHGTVDRELCGLDLPYGANMAIRRDLLGAVPFHPRLGHRGDASMGWEEWNVLANLPGRIVYVAAAVVEHHFDVDRMSWQNVRRANFIGGMGAARHVRISGETARVSVARAAVRSVRAWRRVRRAQVDNPLTSTSAGEALEAYRRLGFELEQLIGSIEPLADLVARRALR